MLTCCNSQKFLIMYLMLHHLQCFYCLKFTTPLKTFKWFLISWVSLYDNSFFTTVSMKLFVIAICIMNKGVACIWWLIHYHKTCNYRPNFNYVCWVYLYSLKNVQPWFFKSWELIFKVLKTKYSKCIPFR